VDREVARADVEARRVQAEVTKRRFAADRLREEAEATRVMVRHDVEEQ
jgi:hypothetical protein